MFSIANRSTLIISYTYSILRSSFDSLNFTSRRDSQTPPFKIIANSPNINRVFRKRRGARGVVTLYVYASYRSDYSVIAQCAYVHARESVLDSNITHAIKCRLNGLTGYER